MLPGTTSHRPQTTTSRPHTSLSVRPSSSASTRPQSRFSQRPSSRQARSRLLPFCQTLVEQITGSTDDGVEYAVKHLEGTTLNKAAVGVDVSVIDRQISGHVLKAKINSQDALAEALDTAYRQLKVHLGAQEQDLDHTIKAARLPDHLQFLLALSQQPNKTTLIHAQSYLYKRQNPSPPPKPLTWAEILADDPFEGEHWEGVYGLPPGFVRHSVATEKEKDDWASSPSLSPLNSDDLALDDSSSSSSDFEELRSPKSSPLREHSPKPPSVAERQVLPYAYEQRKRFEEMQARQYWRDEWRTAADVGADFDIGDPSTLGPTLNRVLAKASGQVDAHSMLAPERYIDEDDMVREVLMALQGNKNIVFTWSNNRFATTSQTPRLIHLTLASQDSILTSLARTATTIAQLRTFSQSTIAYSHSLPKTQAHPSTNSNRKFSSYPKTQNPPTTRTCEAFADAIDSLIRTFDSWCAAREIAITRAMAGVDSEPLLVSLLDTEKALKDTYEDSFDVLLTIARSVFFLSDSSAGTDKSSGGRDAPSAPRLTPAAQTALLLDTLFSEVQRHAERQDSITSTALMHIFVRTAQPVWAMVGKWLANGMGGGGATAEQGLELEEEFFIERTISAGVLGLGLLDPEFWGEGYALRGGEGGRDVPAFLAHVAGVVLGAGKAVGLGRVLGVGLGPGLGAGAGTGWRAFEDVVKGEGEGVFGVSVDRLKRMVLDEVGPYCLGTGTRLVRVLVKECGLRGHLSAIEGFYLMMRGDTMSHFMDVLFAKMDSQQSWSDFHFLNTAFNDVVSSNSNTHISPWIHPPLIRLSYRGTREKEKSITRTVKALDALAAEYALPFPLTYLFQPGVMQRYSEVFVFLVQVRRGKAVLERILVREGKGGRREGGEGMKMLYAMRSRLSWFVNTLLNFLTVYVIHAEVEKFHKAFEGVELFDDMIKLHEDHLEKMRGRCLLKQNTSALHRAIISILDICLRFSNAFTTLAGDTTATLDISRQSISIKGHRSRRLKRQRRDIIAFSQSIRHSSSSSSSEDDDYAGDEAEGPIRNPLVSEPSLSLLSADEGIFASVERMSGELDGLVRFLRRGVESLAGGAGEAAQTFGVLAFALEDWDI